MIGAQIHDGKMARDFILAGNARVTIVSERTGTRYTYRLRQTDSDRPGQLKTPHFVSLLNGPDNNSAYEFFGTIFDRQTFVHGRRARITKDAPSVIAFLFAWTYLVDGRMPPKCEVWHEGRCGRCQRSLTVPESIASGLGPECRKKM